jgi:hypothetical protein
MLFIPEKKCDVVLSDLFAHDVYLCAVAETFLSNIKVRILK